MGYYLDVLLTFFKFVSTSAPLQVLWWWLILAAIGFLFLPLSLRLFDKFHDRGYIFSKALGLGALGYLTWLAYSLHLLPFTFYATLAIAVAVGLIVFFAFRGISAVREYAKLWRVVLLEECIFLAALMFWAFMRTLNPEILSLEKFMNFGFMNAALKSTYMPPADMWFAGKSINYYYFGHFLTAWLTKLSCLPADVTYNLMVSALFGFCASFSFSIGSNLLYLARGTRDRLVTLSGALAAMLATLGGSAHAFVYMVLLKALDKLGLYNGFMMPYYFPQATRYIGYDPPTADRTISEVPSYSFIVSDLHAHVLAIPFTLLFVGLLISLVTGLSFQERRGPLRGTQFGKLIAMGLLLGVLGMTNTWTLPIYFTLMLTVVVVVAVKERMGTANVVALPIIMGVTVVVLAAAALWPFIANYYSPASEVVLVKAHSRLYQLFVLWGYQFLMLSGFLMTLGRTRTKPNKIDWLALAVCMVSAGLIIAPEIVAVKDIYPESFRRANTMFKFTYEAFIMLALCSGYFAVRIVTMGKVKRWVSVVRIALVAMVVAMPMVYPLIAIRQGYRPPVGKPYYALDGLKFLDSYSPGDYGAIMWLRENVTGQRPILEATGNGYTDVGRISMATGLPTVLGWYDHEWLWRADEESARARTMDVRSMYDSGDVATVEALLLKYDVRYIIIGNIERRQYSLIQADTLRRFGTVVYNQDGTEIIQLP